eukprot:1158363-Pelagomonas_calceolata.AAC.1
MHWTTCPRQDAHTAQGTTVQQSLRLVSCRHFQFQCLAAGLTAVRKLAALQWHKPRSEQELRCHPENASSSSAMSRLQAVVT